MDPDRQGKGRAQPRLGRRVWDPLLAPCPRGEASRGTAVDSVISSGEGSCGPVLTCPSLKTDSTVIPSYIPSVSSKHRKFSDSGCDERGTAGPLGP